MFKKILSIFGNKNKEKAVEPSDALSGVEIYLSDITVDFKSELPKKLTGVKKKFHDLQKQMNKNARDKDFKAAAKLQRKSIELAEQNKLELRPTDYIRLARHLQASGNNDEGWKVFNESKILQYTEIHEKIEIFNAMRIFLEREKKYKLAVQYGIAFYLFGVESDRVWIKEQAKENKKLMSDFEKNAKPDDWEAEHIDSMVKMLEDDENRLSDKIDKSVIKGLVESLLKKTKLQEAEIELVDMVESHINSNKTLNTANLFRQVTEILNKYDS